LLSIQITPKLTITSVTYCIDCYQKAITIKPSYAEAHNNLGIMLRAIGRVDEALQAFDKAIGLAPKRAAFY
jgi:Flp pilus assembly protein TadD